MQSDESIAAVIDTRDYETHRFLVIATKRGVIKKTAFQAYDSSRRDGIIAIKLRQDDEVMQVRATSGENELIMVSRKGQAIIFNESEVRPMGRDAQGVIGMKFKAEDWLEAFRAHPRIGEKKAEAGVGEDARRWSEGEQSRAREASDETKAALVEANREYEEKFGFIFIVCATGKSAEEMLGLLRGRLKDDRETELRVAASEQWRITELRVRKFLDAP